MFRKTLTEAFRLPLRYLIWSFFLGMLLGFAFKFGNDSLRSAALSSAIEQFTVHSTVFLAYVGVLILTFRIAVFGRIESTTPISKTIQHGALELLAVLSTVTCGIVIGFMLPNLGQTGALYSLALSILAFIAFVFVPCIAIAFSYKGILTDKERYVRVGAIFCFSATALVSKYVVFT